VRVAVTGASGVLGRGLVARLLSQGHDVVGIARHRPESWPSVADFVAADIRHAAAVRRAVTGADVVAHCAWAKSPGAADRISHQVNIGGTLNVLEAMAETGTGRIVFASSAHVYGPGEAARMTEHDAMTPASADGVHKACVEEMLAASGADWVAIRSALLLGRSVNNWVQRLLALPAFPDIDGSADRRVQVVHADDALRMFICAILATGIGSGPVNLAAPGEPTFRQIAGVLGRPIVPLGGRAAALRRRLTSLAELELVWSAPLMDTTRLRDEWGFSAVWNSDE
jgi:nucleoside-diphosphate-sugar epimerase